MAEAASSVGNLHADTIKNYGMLKKHLPPAVDEVMTDLLECEGLSWEEYKEIKTLPTEPKRAEHLLDLMIDKQRLDVFHDVFRKYNPSTVDLVLKGEGTSTSPIDKDTHTMLQDMYDMLKQRNEKDDQRDKKNEERDKKNEERDKKNEERDKKNEERDKNNEERDKQMEEFKGQIKLLIDGLNCMTGWVKQLNTDLKEKNAQISESSEARAEIIDKYDNLKDMYDKLNMDNVKLRDLQRGLRQRIMALEERLKQVHAENSTLKCDAQTLAGRVDSLEIEKEKLTTNLESLQRDFEIKQTFMYMIECQLKEVKNEKTRLNEVIKVLRDRKSSAITSEDDSSDQQVTKVCEYTSAQRSTAIKELQVIRNTRKY